MEIDVTPAAAEEKREKPRDESSLGFGKFFSDHMFRMRYREGEGWHDARIIPYRPLTLDPAAMVFHYGQAVFEGLKCYRGPGGSLCLFRPKENFERMNRSARRLCIPEVPAADAMAALSALLRLDREWVPAMRGTSLYIRPATIATEPALGVRPSAEYLFFIITGPVGNYYARGIAPLRIVVEETHVRAARGGLGEVKTGANYAASLSAARSARESGFDQVLWLCADGRREVEEVGTMNIFFVIGEEVVTPPLSGSILPGVTRDSVLRIAKDWSLPVAERPVTMEELMGAAADGTLREAFGTGTAAVIAPVGALRYRGKEIVLNRGAPGELSRKLLDEITGIQYGEIPDRYGWVHRVE